MTKFIGLIGYPLEHSISPIFQQAALDHYKLDIKYETWDIPPEKLVSVEYRLRHPDVIGANVTLPYKQEMLNIVNKCGDMVSVIGALNTIVNREGILEGYNTDIRGFIRGLREQAKFDPENKKIAIIGAGGAARAVCFALLNEDINTLTLTNRTSENVENLVKSLQSTLAHTTKKTEIHSYEWLSSQFREKLQEVHLIVNCTTMGLKHSLYEGKSPLPPDWIPQNVLVYDLVYNPLETPLLKAAKSVGANVLNGSYMLLYQGAAAFEIWTGREAPLDIMYNVIQATLSSRR